MKSVKLNGEITRTSALLLRCGGAHRRTGAHLQPFKKRRSLVQCPIPLLLLQALLAAAMCDSTKQRRHHDDSVATLGTQCVARLKRSARNIQVSQSSN